MIDKTPHDADSNANANDLETLDIYDHNKPAKHGSVSGWFALFIAILALFFTVVGIAAGYKHWQRMHDKVRTNMSEITTLKQQVTQAPDNSAIEALRQELTEKANQSLANHTEALQEMARMQNQTRQFADTVASQVEQVTFLQARMQQNAAPATAKEWQIAEVTFLLQMANRELHLANNPQTAKASLKEADTLLASVGSVNYLPVRQQIARDISALDATPLPDITGVAQQIHAMILALKPLPALTETATSDAPTTDIAASDTIDGNSLWADYKRKAGEMLNDAVVVRRFDKPLQSALDADARQHLFQLLHLRLETLRLLVLQRDNSGFHAQIALLRETLKSYYPATQAKPLLENLDKLGKLELQPTLPDISASLKQLESARQADNAQLLPVENAEKPVENGKKPNTTKDNSKGGKDE
ncbi:uroporphyrinogen-III C-methyltransferase [Candidatus Thiothrix anitrata]|uniref:Uroporphyrinogen-III C-methyltransferase n=1 Tax=Candidatus Thiothrix anitrata TaxID=2823902 RepID=A0ABX7X7F9_9GAMM|nr:uroporphyrinogen-III C-methyltransferase [Candidatus Thiothrix anitrata]QTR50883.1 uroporphyrinogen-III C-methyltransferase [Candidatus Thiothrix anitrata]